MKEVSWEGNKVLYEGKLPANPVIDIESTYLTEEEGGDILEIVNEDVEELENYLKSYRRG